jgi:hypothetical protein
MQFLSRRLLETLTEDRSMMKALEPRIREGAELERRLIQEAAENIQSLATLKGK